MGRGGGGGGGSWRDIRVLCVVVGGVRVVLRGFGDGSWLVLGTSCGSGCSAG